MESHVTIWVAFGAGLLSFVSPCTLPLFPSYLGYISGVSFQKISGDHSNGGPSGEARARAFLHAVFFSLGLCVLFIALGYGATAVGHVLQAYKTYVRVVGGCLIIAMGLFMAGVIRSEWLLQERRFHLPAKKPLGLLGSFVVGVIFAAGWTPCIGPILSIVLTLVITNPTVGTWYMVLYAIGFTVPFLVLAVTMVSIRPLLRYTRAVSMAGGWLLCIMGILLVTNKMVMITAWIQRTTHFSGF